MDLSQVQARLGACSEPELKKMLKDMELPVKGNKEELVARIIEQMKADADAAAEEESDDEEGMDLSQVQAKLGACSEPELKKMLKDMELPVKGNKEELVARIIESMQREAEEEDDDDSEEEDGEDATAGAACNSAGKRTRPVDAETPAAKRSAKGKQPAKK